VHRPAVGRIAMVEEQLASLTCIDEPSVASRSSGFA
jgi:hypothetical protein